VLPAAATGLLGPLPAAAATAAASAVLLANSLRLQRHGTTGG
jgi:cation transport ATPase